MAKWVPDSYMDLMLIEIQKSDEEAVCNAQPTTYFNAIWPDLWIQSTTYSVGDAVYPPTQNGFIYECLVAGDSGAAEPGWGTVQDQEFTDGTVTWKTHENYALVNSLLVPGDKVLANGTVDGRKLTIAEKTSIVTHTTGTVSHTALLEHATKTVHFVTTAQTTLGGNNDVEAGRTTIFFEFDIAIRDPQ